MTLTYTAKRQNLEKMYKKPSHGPNILKIQLTISLQKASQHSPTEDPSPSYNTSHYNDATMFKPSSTLFAASLLLAPSLIQAQSNCRRNGHLLSNDFINTIDNASCDEQGTFFTIVKGIDFGCVGISGTGCTQDGTTATFSMTESVFCTDSSVQAAVKTVFGVDVDCQ